MVPSETTARTMRISDSVSPLPHAISCHARLAINAHRNLSSQARLVGSILRRGWEGCEAANIGMEAQDGARAKRPGSSSLSILSRALNSSHETPSPACIPGGILGQETRSGASTCGKLAHAQHHLPFQVYVARNNTSRLERKSQGEVFTGCPL